MSVRYIANDVEAAVGFDLRLLLSIPGGGGAGEAMPDGRNDIVVGRGGRQTLVEDPSGNCIELFEPS